MNRGLLPAIVLSSVENNGFRKNRKGIRHVNGYIHLPQFYPTSTRFHPSMGHTPHCKFSLGCQCRSDIGIIHHSRFFKWLSIWRSCRSSCYGPHNRYSGFTYRDSDARSRPYNHCSPCSNTSISINVVGDYASSNSTYCLSHPKHRWLRQPIRKEHTMSTTSLTYSKVIMVRRLLVIGVIITLVVAVTTGFVWLQTDHVIAPPNMRVTDWFWRVFVCGCPV